MPKARPHHRRHLLSQLWPGVTESWVIWWDTFGPPYDMSHSRRQQTEPMLAWAPVITTPTEGQKKRISTSYAGGRLVFLLNSLGGVPVFVSCFFLSYKATSSRPSKKKQRLQSVRRTTASASQHQLVTKMMFWFSAFCCFYGLLSVYFVYLVILLYRALLISWQETLFSFWKQRRKKRYTTGRTKKRKSEKEPQVLTPERGSDSTGSVDTAQIVTISYVFLKHICAERDIYI